MRQVERFAVLGAAIVLTMFSLDGAARAQQTQLYACVNNSSGTIKMVAPGTVCDNGATLFTWNIVGAPSWDQQLPAAQRFIVLQNWNNEAVLDRETGLVWESQPVSNKFTWSEAMVACRSHLVGNRRGWRLPSYEELTSLLDGTHVNPALPVGHPFLGISFADIFWTVTQVENDSSGNGAYTVTFSIAEDFHAGVKTASNRIWCVRGGSATANPPY